jgi:hypothetical protein
VGRFKIRAGVYVEGLWNTANRTVSHDKTYLGRSSKKRPSRCEVAVLVVIPRRSMTADRKEIEVHGSLILYLFIYLWFHYEAVNS